MQSRLTSGLVFGAALLLLAFSALVLTGVFRSEAVQAPRLSLDMNPSGNVYSDPGMGGNNSMSVGPIDSCLSTVAPGNNLAHNHTAHVIIENVEDLEGWQLRMNYDGGKMRPLSAGFAPFTDTLRAQSISFQNLPIDSGSDAHRDLTPGVAIPPPAAGPQTALIGSTYNGERTLALSPDTPAKAPPDDGSYSAPTGGVVASVTLRVEAGNAGQTLTIDADDSSPNPPGSEVLVFTGSGTQEFELAESALGDGSHGEGVACGAPPSPCPTPGPTAPPMDVRDETFTNQLGQSASDLHARYNGPIGACLLSNAPGCPAPTINRPEGGFAFDLDWGTACVDSGESVTVRVTSEPPASRICSDWTLSGVIIGPANPPSCATPTPPPPTSPPVAGHDARLAKIGGVPKNVRLSPGEVINDNASVVVANDGNHTETIGVYVDVNRAMIGCTPHGRVLQTTVTLAAGAKTTLNVPVAYSCTDPASANGLSYSWTAVADHGADDLSSCGVGTLQNLTCFNALADDDEDPADNRKARTGPKVVAQ